MKTPSVRNMVKRGQLTDSVSLTLKVRQLMKRFGVIHAALVSLAVLGVSASGYAQREQQNDKQPKREEQARPEKQQSNQPRQSQNNQQHAQQQERHGRAEPSPEDHRVILNVVWRSFVTPSSLGVGSKTPHI